MEVHVNTGMIDEWEKEHTEPTETPAEDEKEKEDQERTGRKATDEEDNKNEDLKQKSSNSRGTFNGDIFEKRLKRCTIRDKKAENEKREG